MSLSLLCLFHLLIQKKIWPLSIFLNVVKYFWPCSNMQNYKVKYHFWPCSKIFDQVQKILNKAKKVWTWSKYFWTSRRNRHNFSATYPDCVRKKNCWVIFIENTYLSMGPRRRVTSMAHFFFNLFQTIWQIPIEFLTASLSLLAVQDYQNYSQDLYSQQFAKSRGFMKFHFNTESWFHVVNDIDCWVRGHGCSLILFFF